MISPAKNLWHCLGACQAGGSVVDWVMRAEGVSFRHAVELLRADAPSLVASSSPASSSSSSSDEAKAPARSLVKHSTVKKLAAPVERDADDEAALVQVVDYYQRTLKESPEALEYLERRGLRHAEMVEHFHLGYANRTLGYRLPDKNRAAGAALRGRLQRLGVLRESGHEHLSGSVVVPIFDDAGRVVEMYGRKVGTQLRASAAKHLYLPGPHRGVWNAAAVRASKELVLCESLIDALTFWCAGYRHVTASYGVEGFALEHLELFSASGTERVLIAYDRDEAGDRAAEKLAKVLAERGMEALRVIFPKGYPR